MAECSVSPRNAAERKERDEARYRHFGPEIKKALDKERAKNEQLRAFVGLVLEYCEKETPYWYGEDLKTRARKLLKEANDA